MPVNAKERMQKMSALYKEGKTLQEIGDVFTLSRERVRQILRECGVESLGRRESKAATIKLTAEEKKIAAIYQKGEVRPAQILKDFKLDYAGLQSILKRANVEIKPKGFFNRRPDYDRIRTGIITDYQRGDDTAEIAERYGLCGKTEIYKFIKREGIEPRASRSPRSRAKAKAAAKQE